MKEQESVNKIENSSNNNTEENDMYHYFGIGDPDSTTNDSDFWVRQTQK